MEIGAVANSQVNVVDRDQIGFAGLSSDQFLELLITELQNQDPLEPLSNDQIVTQLSSMRELESNLALKNTLSSLVGQQEFGVASGLIGKLISGFTADDQNVEGVVDRVTFEDGGVLIGVGEHALPLKNVFRVQAA